MYAVYTPKHHLTDAPDVREYYSTKEEAQEIADWCNKGLKPQFRNYRVVDMGDD